MRWALACSAFLAAVLSADTPVDAQPEPGLPPVLQRFLETVEHGPSSYRAFRRLEARNSHLSHAAWMNVWTTADASGFTYEIVGQGGSDYVRDRVFLPALDAERAMWGAGARGAVTPQNYTFEDRGAEPTGLAWIGVKPRRKDVLLVNGSIFLRPEDGDLVRIEGALSRTPSFWTRKVEIVRRYDRICGVRLPVALESVASVLMVGKATFTMSYEYQSVNGVDVALDLPAAPAAGVSREP
jgi:hypothetical protein